MPLLEVMVTGLLFVVSSGILYNERFRRNKLLVGLAALLAIGSTFSLLGALGGSSSSNRDGDSAVVDMTTDTSATLSLPMNGWSDSQQPRSRIVIPGLLAARRDSPTARPPGSGKQWGCDWRTSISMTGCIERLSVGRSVREATAMAFESHALRMLETPGKTAQADSDFTVAIANRDSGNELAYLYRGYARLQQHQYASAYSDCSQLMTLKARGNLWGQAWISRISITNAMGTLHICLGESLVNLGRHREAIAQLDTAVQFKAFENGFVYTYRAESKRALGDSVGAESDERIGNTMESEALAKAFGVSP
jgi:hypothetical protein